MNKIKTIALIALASMALAGCSKVTPGNVGVKVNNWGSEAGVDPKPLGIGMYFTGPGTDIYEYPISTRTYSWTKSSTEGSTNNEEFSLSDKNGLVVTADVAVAYHIDSDKAPLVFQKYRMDMDSIVAGPLHTTIRNALNDESSKMSIEEIYGPRRAELLNLALKDVQKYFTPIGINIEQLNWTSPIRVPGQIEKQINQKIANEQAALAAQAAVATAEANSRAKIATAEGDAKATTIEAEAIRSNPQILQQRWIEKWDGKLPDYIAGQTSSLIMQMPSK